MDPSFRWGDGGLRKRLGEIADYGLQLTRGVVAGFVVRDIETFVSRFGTGVLDAAKAATNIRGPIMYLTVDDLVKLRDRLNHEAAKQNIMSLYG